MTQSLKDYGQVSPIIVCQLGRTTVLVDWASSATRRPLASRFTHSQGQQLERVDEQGAKAAPFISTRSSVVPSKLKKAWLIFALVRGRWTCNKVEAALMLGRIRAGSIGRLAL